MQPKNAPFHLREMKAPTGGSFRAQPLPGFIAPQWQTVFQRGNCASKTLIARVSRCSSTKQLTVQMFKKTRHLKLSCRVQLQATVPRLHRLIKGFSMGSVQCVLRRTQPLTHSLCFLLDIFVFLVTFVLSVPAVSIFVICSYLYDLWSS